MMEVRNDSTYLAGEYWRERVECIQTCDELLILVDEVEELDASELFYWRLLRLREIARRGEIYPSRWAENYLLGVTPVYDEQLARRSVTPNEKRDSISGESQS